MDYWHVSKSKGLVIKLDIEKAFDKISWNFILSVMKLKGFNKWINWISACLSTVNYYVLLNGKPRGFIHATRGIRQGDPLSPFLLVLGMDYLSSLNEEAQRKNLITGFYY